MSKAKEREKEVNSEPPKFTRQQIIWQRIFAVIRAMGPLLMYLVIPSFLMSVAYNIFGKDRTMEEFTHTSGNFYMVMGICLCIFFFFLKAKKKKVSLWEQITLSVSRKDIPYCLLLAAIGASIALAVSAVLTVIPFPDFLKVTYEDYSQDIYHGMDVLLVILCQIVMAPFAEEVVFRGYMLNRLLKVFSEKTCIIVVSILFGLCHISGIWVLYAVFMGYFLTKIAMKEDNILYSIALHVGFNFPSIVIFFLNSNEKTNQVLFGNKFLIIIYGLIGVCLAILLWRKYKELRKWN